MAGDGNALLSQHLGDLDELKNQNAWRQALGLYRSLFDTKPDLIVADRNPGYRSTQLAMELARETAARFVQVQHHHAHLASCLAQHGRAIDAPPVLGIILDGLGYGDDGTIWGGEFLLGGYRGFRRLAYFEAVAMPGGDRPASSRGAMPMRICGRLSVRISWPSFPPIGPSSPPWPKSRFGCWTG